MANITTARVESPITNFGKTSFNPSFRIFSNAELRLFNINSGLLINLLIISEKGEIETIPTFDSVINAIQLAPPEFDERGARANLFSRTERILGLFSNSVFSDCRFLELRRTGLDHSFFDKLYLPFGNTEYLDASYNSLSTAFFIEDFYSLRILVLDGIPDLELEGLRNNKTISFLSLLGRKSFSDSDMEILASMNLETMLVSQSVPLETIARLKETRISPLTITPEVKCSSLNPLPNIFPYGSFVRLDLDETRSNISHRQQQLYFLSNNSYVAWLSMLGWNEFQPDVIAALASMKNLRGITVTPEFSREDREQIQAAIMQQKKLNLSRELSPAQQLKINEEWIQRISGEIKEQYISTQRRQPLIIHRV